MVTTGMESMNVQSSDVVVPKKNVVQCPQEN